MHRVAVLGKGLFGAATARHLAANDCETVIVGPDEPLSDEPHEGPHGAHYDEARIMVARGDQAEFDLTVQTISGMIDLERESGIDFLVHSGAIEVTEPGVGDFRIDEAVRIGSGAQFMEPTPPQGYFNPRRYIQAALSVTAKSGGTIVRDTARGLRRIDDRFEVATAGGEHVLADTVVVAAGAWTNRLLERPVRLRRKQEYVLFCRLKPEIAADLAFRPVMIHGPVRAVHGVYTLPPLRYPDGEWYIKLGANTRFDQEVPDSQIDHWYASGDSDVASSDLWEAFRTVFPDIPVVATHTERCVITYTAHGRPYLDELAPGLFVATGGNGHGASWADGAGKLVADLAMGRPWVGFDRSAFEVVWE